MQVLHSLINRKCWKNLRGQSHNIYIFCDLNIKKYIYSKWFSIKSVIYFVIWTWFPSIWITIETMVCSRHFKLDDFKWTLVRKLLKPESIPSVFKLFDELFRFLCRLKCGLFNRIFRSGLVVNCLQSVEKLLF